LKHDFTRGNPAIQRKGLLYGEKKQLQRDEQNNYNEDNACYKAILAHALPPLVF
jgi:hypothetical protein